MIRKATCDIVDDKSIEAWFQDAARVGQQGTLAYIWVERGSRPQRQRDCRRSWAYIFGTVCPDRAAGAALVMPRVNIGAMNKHLEAISQAVTPGAHAALVVDGAGWHRTGGDLKVPCNITLTKIPPYVPELNSIENIWQYLRGNKRRIQVW
jgi:hypothetical protein